ncbi:MAG TPA: LuxR C-terminal-related transcriptional regulator [Solirubrobacteraceae bacterium]|jgi:DNA-binding CsgD family transcriptional regulator|nr:LuxR C-terminal-related transcriptional regulator [Solirubrobacteraceae bacterium]
MQLDTSVATAILTAIRLAAEQGGAEAALRATGIELPEPTRFEGMAKELDSSLGHWATDKSIADALALGFLAGRVGHRSRARTAVDPTAFVMDRQLIVQGAEGESILRLPWIEEGLFVGRELHEITEVPTPVRVRCIEHYSAALAGERGRFAFTSYGHAYSVDAVPVYGVNGCVDAVLAIALPVASHISAAVAYERTAERLDRSAARAEQRAELDRLAGRGEAERTDQRAAHKARDAAERARINARRLRLRAAQSGSIDAPALTPRETEVLELASHGLTSAQIAEQLVLSVATVTTHLQNIYPKLGVNSKAAAVGAALRHRLID